MSDSSDHYPVFANLAQKKIVKYNPTKRVSYFNNTCVKNMSRLHYQLLSTDWTDVWNDENPDSAYSKFSETIRNECQSCCPLTLSNHRISSSSHLGLHWYFKSIPRKKPIIR